MGRSFRVARLIALAVVWEGQTRADIAPKQVDHRNRKRDDNSPENLVFLEAEDDAGRSAQSQNTRSALLQGPSWLEKAEDAKATPARCGRSTCPIGYRWGAGSTTRRCKRRPRLRASTNLPYYLRIVAGKR